MEHGAIRRELWRISNHHSLAAVGGRLAGGRWHTAGRPIIYLAESAAGALLEILVQLDLEDEELPRSYNLMRVMVPIELKIEALSAPEGNSWKYEPATTQAIGGEWLTTGRSALARVPSVIMPSTWNYLLNPSHADAARVEIAEVTPADFDSRLLRKVRP